MLRSPAWLLAATFVAAISLQGESRVRGEEPFIIGGELVAREITPDSLVQQITAQRAELLVTLQQLQDAYCRALMLDEAVAVRDQIRRLQQDAAAPLARIPDPRQPNIEKIFKSPNQMRESVGESFYGQVTGSTEGSVWGSGIYTSDSNLSVAAVHAGFLKPEETKIVRFTMLAGRPVYAGSELNGVATRDWEAYPSSFRIDGAAISAQDVNLIQMRGQDVGSLTLFVVGGVVQSRTERLAERMAPVNSTKWIATVGVHVRGDVDLSDTLQLVEPPATEEELARLPGMVPSVGQRRTIWGGEEGVYTDDSPVAIAAVHAGILAAGQPGFVTVELLPGRAEYKGSSQHGIESQAYGQWEGSYRIKAFEPVAEEKVEFRSVVPFVR